MPAAASRATEPNGSQPLRGAPGRETAPYLALLLVVLAALVPYLNTLANAFVFDDVAVVRDNPLIRELGGIPRLFRENYWAPLDRSNLYRPLTMVSFSLNRALTGPEPWGFHLFNVLLHVLASGLVLLSALRLGCGRASAALAAALFGAHPLHTEAVTGIVGRAEVLAACGVLAAIALHAAAKGHGIGRPLLLCILTLAAFLCKEIALGLGIALACHDLARWRHGQRPRIAVWTLLALTATLYIGIRDRALGGVDPFNSPALSRLDNSLVGVPAVPRLLTSASILGRFAGLTAWPARLSADYSHAQIETVHSLLHPSSAAAWAVLGLVVALASAALLCHAVVRGNAALATGLGLFAGSYFIVSNAAVLIGTIMGERLFYLPSAGIALALASVSDRISRRPAVAAVLIGITAAFGIRSGLRNTDWRDPLTLFSRTAETAPRSIRARVYFAEELRRAGNPGAAHEQLQKAIQIDPTEAWSWNALSRLHGTTDPGRAREALETALRLNPRFAEATYNLGCLNVWTGRFEEAVPLLEQALRLKPYYPEAWLALGEARLGLGHLEEARRALELAIAARPDRSPVQFNYARLLESEGRAREALESYLAATVCVEPPMEAFTSAARLLAESRRFAEAEATLARARGSFGPSIALENALGVVLLLAGDREGARAAFGRTLAIEPANAFARSRLEQLAVEEQLR